MDFATPKNDPKCLLSAAHGWMGLMNFVFGEVSIDNTRYAKIGLQGSLREIDSSEEELKIELEAVLGRIRAMQSKHKGVERVKSLLVQHRKIRGRMDTLQRKREVLQNHMETLENSELNQQVLYSMQRTSHALKAMGLDKSLQSVDRVMLDLEENHNDMNSLQHSLGTGYTDDDEPDWGLELNHIMNDGCFLEQPEVCNSTRRPDNAPAKVAAPPADVFADAPERAPEAEATNAAAEDAAEDAVKNAAKNAVKNAEHAVIA
jgi:cell division protein FtsB